MKIIKLITFIIILQSFCLAQDKAKFIFDFLPAGLHLPPLKGHFQESRMGILYNPQNAQLKLDIGNTVDLFGIHSPSINSKLTFGAEFYAYAHSTSYNGNRLQIDALDGFFGGNAVFSKNCISHRLFTRLRVIHNSAHFVDGHFDKQTNSWKDNTNPIPFTRDYGELFFVVEKIFQMQMIKFYGGITYATLVRPLEIKKWSYDTGFEYSITNLAGKFFGKDENIFAAYHFNLFGIPEYLGNNNFVVGMKFGEWAGKGISVYLNYYSGNNIFNEYYKDRVKKFGIGFTFDFP